MGSPAPTPNQPPPIGGDDTPFGKCAVGLRNVTIAFTDCASGASLIQWSLLRGWTSDIGSLVLQSNGSPAATVYCVLPGIKYRVINPGYKDVDFEITAADVASRTKLVCMDRLPPPPPRPRGRCCFTTAALTAFGDEDNAGVEAALEPLRLFRKAIEGNGRGAELVRLYDDADIASMLTEAVSSDKQLALQVVSILLELQPLLHNLETQYWWAGVGLNEAKAPLESRGKMARLQPATVHHIVKLCEQLNDATGGKIKEPLNLLAQQVEEHTNLDVFAIVSSLQRPLKQD
jgi:hypothetical protein